MITRLYCDNYKCLVDFEYHPAPVQLVMGRNGSGKSTVFAVLELIRDIAARGEMPTDRLGGATKTRWQDVAEQTFELDVEGPQGTYRYRLVVAEAGRPCRPHVVTESLTVDGHPLYARLNNAVHLHNDRFEEHTRFPSNYRCSLIATIEPSKENTKLTWFKEWLERLLYVQIDPKRMRAEAAREVLFPAHDLSDFGEWYRYLRQDNSVATDALRQSLSDVIDGFQSLDLKGPPGGSRSLQVTALAGKNGERTPRTFGFDELSDGQRTLVGLYALLHCSLEKGATLCIDEPDNFVALREIQPWLSEVVDLAQANGSQLLFASHHPELLNQLATRDGVVIERIDGGPARVRPFESIKDPTLTPAEVVARGWENG